MLLPPSLYSRLAGAPGAAEPLPVERNPAAGAAPFRFTPRPVHFPRDHEFFEDGDVQRHLYLQDMLTQVSETPEKSMVPEFTCQVAGCCQVFAALEDYQHHYHMLHGNTCSLCSRAFPSGHLLDVHILEWHDSLFQILAQSTSAWWKAAQRSSRPAKTGRITCPAMPAAAEPPARALKDDSDAMEISSEPAAPPPCRRTYSHRIPSTVCFGQGAARGFKSTKKRNKQH
ncbi:zinc finger protein 511 isoform X2 [Alexandromys fortis]|uniref:zinc finger protein 511 isoform X2 n=1 Tax=Alexandromys fortis TaxID=100897 RepID=UPI0021531668|nr:zinc finger protein 511 isoform X2 [Microtus fortis]